MPPLAPAELQRRLASLPGWEVREGALRRAYAFPDFTAAMAFANRVAQAAEAADHHPDMLVGYGRVELAWVSHSAGGITERDVEMAARSDLLAGST
ncbi:MAG TPA: 4a-hydroxytetrahydrobiopterin dehydratase [Gaiellales bacterium]|nr:4a-hydroxytetrahydrobiopterin dehydratase [Gaiellales bacterium]